MYLLYLGKLLRPIYLSKIKQNHEISQENEILI